MQETPSDWRLCWLVLILTLGCSPASSVKNELQVELAFSPSPPVVGKTEVTLKVAAANGDSVDGAEVRLEGNMNHAGMKPSFANLEEVEPGSYVGTLNFTMGGDWYVLVTVKTPEGQTSQHKVDVPGVKAP